jgi:hypothetical protein
MGKYSAEDGKLAIFRALEDGCPSKNNNLLWVRAPAQMGKYQSK